jgi:hypothetical protein
MSPEQITLGRIPLDHRPGTGRHFWTSPMTPEQLNRELTDLVTRTRRLLAQVEADLPRMEPEETKVCVVPFDPPQLPQAA